MTRRQHIRRSLLLRNWEELDLPSGLAPPPDFLGFDDRCRRCGCTDLDCRECIERTGEPCWWAEEDLCSACAAEAGAQA